MIPAAVYIARKDNKKEVQSKLESVADMISDDTLSVKPNGLIELPDDLNELSDGIYVFRWIFRAKPVFISILSEEYWILLKAMYLLPIKSTIMII